MSLNEEQKKWCSEASIPDVEGLFKSREKLVSRLRAIEQEIAKECCRLICDPCANGYIVSESKERGFVHDRKRGELYDYTYSFDCVADPIRRKFKIGTVSVAKE